MPERKQRETTNLTAIGDGNVQIVGNKNVVNQTIIQKFFNIFKSDAETVEQRNRRIMLNHVENFWVKGILEKSLHGAALLDLGIKEDLDAVTYPWAIKREATKETLSADKSMLEIFQEIGMGRSLLILGAPGSGKTTMLLELTRQLIERAREDVTEPIPVVFNLSSWTENLSLADWLARELNTIYYVPKKVAPTWVKENKILLLLDGLDEVKEESRDNCVDAINQFRKENGLTSITVCSRSQDYTDLKTRLSFDGAIEVQPLTAKQVDGYFKRFGKGSKGIRQVLEKDIVLREMAENPLFLNIMTLAYRDTGVADILNSRNAEEQRGHLFDTYITHMFSRSGHSRNEGFKKQNVMRWLQWLASKMIENNQVPLLIERVQSSWLDERKQVTQFRLFSKLITGLIGALIGVFIGGYFSGQFYAVIFGLSGWSMGLSDELFGKQSEIKTIDTFSWNTKKAAIGLIFGLIGGLVFGLTVDLDLGRSGVLFFGLSIGLFSGLTEGLHPTKLELDLRPGERLFLTARNLFFVSLIGGLGIGLIFGLIIGWNGALTGGLIGALIIVLIFGGGDLIRHYSLRFVLSKNNILPWSPVPFLDHCVDLIFLRRVGGGYIFVHRLLMEHFAAMYQEEHK